MHTTRFCDNLHKVRLYRYSQKTGKPNNLKVLGARTSNDLNKISNIRKGHLCLRDENLILFVRYDVRIETMFGSSLPQIGCRRVDVLFGICVCLDILVFNTSWLYE